jgi:ubiquinone/menaquinone biosynthesis C-methylase UbiE
MTASIPPGPLNLPSLSELLSGADAQSCCASLYANPAVRWVFGDELHPGGEATTRRALSLIGVGPADHLLDVASGKGDSAILAARELGCTVTGIDYSQAGVIDAELAAEAAGVAHHVTFETGHAEELPFADGSFDAVLCECSLCLFGDKRSALSEIRRVLRPGGRVAIADVLAEHDRLPTSLRGALAAAACIGAALSLEELRRLLDVASFDLLTIEPCTGEAAEMAQRVHDRLRGARILLGGQDGLAPTLAEAIALAEAARHAIDEGALDYAILTATRRPTGPVHEPPPEAA